MTTEMREERDLFAHLDDDVWITATDITNGKINAAFNSDSEESQ